MHPETRKTISLSFFLITIFAFLVLCEILPAITVKQSYKLDMAAKSSESKRHAYELADQHDKLEALDIEIIKRDMEGYDVQKAMELSYRLGLVLSKEKLIENFQGEERKLRQNLKEAERKKFPGLYEALASKFGSPVVINPRPHQRAWHQSAMGIYNPSDMSLQFTVESNDKKLNLPFSPAGPYFSEITQTQEGLSLNYLCKDPGMPFDMELTITAPFSPGEEKLSTAPFFYLDIELSSKQREPAEGVLKIGISPVKNGKISPYGNEDYVGYSVSTVYQANSETKRAMEGYLSDGWNIEWLTACRVADGWRAADNSLVWEFRLDEDNPVKKKTVASASFIDADVLWVYGKKCKWRYTNFFKSTVEIIDYAFREQKEIRAKSGQFSENLKPGNLDIPELKELMGMAIQSFFLNTRWVETDDGRDFYFVREGYPSYLSTLDVEYNNAVFYLEYWPELLKKQLPFWIAGVSEGYPPHDLGPEPIVGAGAGYRLEMEVEESCNLLLLEFAYMEETGDRSVAEKHLPVLKEITEFLMNADRNGNGLPDIQTNTTFDDAHWSVYQAPDQIYLGIKTASALTAYLNILKKVDRTADRTEIQNFIVKIRRTVHNSAFNNRLPVYLNVKTTASADPIIVPSSRSPFIFFMMRIHSNEMRPWVSRNGFCIHNPNGVFYLLKYGAAPPFNMEILKSDMERAYEKTMTMFGCSHRNNSDKVWVSQNIWRDMIGVYLKANLDYEGNLKKYFDLQFFLNSRSGRVSDFGGFCDSPNNLILTYYSRGISILHLVRLLDESNWKKEGFPKKLFTQ